MKLHVVLLFLVSLTFGCKEDDVTPNVVTLDYYEETFDIPDLDFHPQSKTVYDYDFAGKLIRSTFFSFDPNVESLVEQRYYLFSYVNGKVDKIEGFLTNSTSPYLEYSYQYADSRVTKITESNHSADIDSEATFSYPSANVVSVAYQFSNGGSFNYEMTIEGNNIHKDKTTRGAQICSNGEYTYDQHPNPFNTLGYVDYTLTNVSVNNKLTENVSYIGCAFPNLKPESYEYEYNTDGYPTEVVTSYAAVDGIVPKSTRRFFYKAR